MHSWMEPETICLPCQIRPPFFFKPFVNFADLPQDESDVSVSIPSSFRVGGLASHLVLDVPLTSLAK
jgi:hypothetical protein